MFTHIRTCSLADSLARAFDIRSFARRRYQRHASRLLPAERKLPGGILSPTGVLLRVHGALKRLDSLGFVSNGNDDSLSSADLSGLDSALATNLSGVKDLFSNTSTGLAVQFNSFLDGTIGDKGSLVTHQTNLTTQSTDIDTQISNMESQILIYQQQLTDGFVAMEVAQSQTNQQLAYLTKTFAST